MEEYFNIRYEFDKAVVQESIARKVTNQEVGYICVADGNILSNVQRDKEYCRVVDEAMFSICDSSWVPLFVKWIYGYNREQYCGSEIFIEIVRSCKYRMMFLGTKQKILDALQCNLTKDNPAVTGMSFRELPFCSVEEFDYKSIAEMIEEDGADIIWIALGAPKQEIFMSRLQLYLKKGVMIAVGAAFNFYSGLDNAPKRAPKWMIKSKLEFLYRISQEPQKQLKRAFGFISVIPRILYKEYKINHTK